jgi:CRP-like cAMP-binding protein
VSKERLLALGTKHQYLKGSVLMREGDRSRHVFVLLDGVVKVTGESPDGRMALLAIRMGGDLVGEFEALDDEPRSSTVTTCGAVVGLLLSQADFLAALRRDSHLQLMVTRSILAKLRASDARRVEFAGNDAQTRLARVLRDLAQRYGNRSGDRVAIQAPVTQAELASLTSVAETTVQKALRRLRVSGIIATGRGSVDILDVNALERVAGGHSDSSDIPLHH